MKYIKLLCLLSLFVLAQLISAQTESQRYRIKGTIKDEVSGKILKKFPIKVKEYNRTVNTDSKGEFLFSMPKGTYTFIFDDYPFEKKEMHIQLSSDTVINITLQTQDGIRYLEEVEVVASKPLTEKAASVSQINARELASIPAMIGERDLIKALSLTAGVSSSGEGSADMLVRGSQHGHNLFLLDNVPLYSTQHMFGMLSAFNPTIIKSADLYKAGFPAQYGGRLASVLDVKSKDADLSKFSGEGEISLLATKASLNIPLIKSKLALNVAGRISNYSFLNIVSFTGLMEGTRLDLHFADINANLLYQPTEKDRLKLTFFHNSDAFDVNQDDFTERIKAWQGNRQQNIGLNWQRTISPQTENRFHFFADTYKFSFGNETTTKGSKDKFLFEIESRIQSVGIEDKLSHRFLDNLTADVGVSLKTYSFYPLKMSLIDTSFIASSKKGIPFEGSLFAQTDYAFLPKQTLNLGLRFSAFGNEKQFFPSLEPRISYHGVFNGDLSLSASMSRMSQNIHRVANPGLGITMEIFQPSDVYLKPEISWNYSLGAAKDFKIGSANMSVKTDLWYKQMNNLVEFKDGYDAFSLILFQRNMVDKTSEYLTQGKGEAYGIDFSGNIMLGRIKLSTDYTLMQARSQFNELNNGQWFAASTDIRHSLAFIGEILLKDGWSFSATWQYRSGRPITLPTAVYQMPNIDFDNASTTFPIGLYSDFPFQTVEGERNNARMRASHHLDIAFNRKYLWRKKYEANFSIGIYNLYNRANPTHYFIDGKRIDGIDYPMLKSISMFPILPSFSWGVKF